MATTVGQHSVAAFTSPVNGTTPIDANTVRGNDNTVRVAYVDHDADPGIHVQSSTLASRPAAGTAGRKWITADTGSYRLWYDDGTRWHEVGGDAISLEAVAGETLAKGDVVSVTGFNNGLSLPIVGKYTGAAPAFAIAEEAITNGSRGYVINTGVLTDVKTDTFGAIGTVLYPAATGTFSATKPTSGEYQVSAYVLRSNANNGVLYVEFSAPRIVERSDNTASTIVLRDASGNFSAGTITATLNGAAPAGSLSGTTLASNVVNSSLTSVGTLTSLTVSGTTTTGAETIRPVDTSYIRISGGSSAGTGANIIVFGESHATVPGQMSLSARGAGNIVSTVGAGAYTWNGGSPTAELMRLSASGNLAVDTNTLYVDAANNRVGVGTASPGFQLHTLGAVTGTYTTSTAQVVASVQNQPSALGSGVNSAFLRLQTSPDAGSSNPIVHLGVVAESYGSNLSSFVVQTRDGGGITERLRVDSSGNLGLGVTPSAWSVLTPAMQMGTAGSFIASQGSTAAIYIGTNAFFDGTNWKYVINGAASRYLQNAGAHSWFNAASGTAGNNISFTQAMTLDASGNLGVGTTSPSDKLEVKFSTNGYIIASNSTDTNTGIKVGNTGRTYGIFADGGSGASNSLRFYDFTASAERARITSGGYFKASDNGTYNSGGVGTDHEFQQSAAGRAVLISNSNNSPTGLLIYYGNVSPNGTGNRFWYCEDSTAVRAELRSNGGLANYTANDVNLSDERVKTEIQPAPSYWDTLKAIEIVTFKYKDQTHDDVNVGVIAQQIEQVNPVWVDTDGFGETPEGEEPLKAVYSEDIKFAAIKALQEAMARIEALEVEVAALKANA